MEYRVKDLEGKALDWAVAYVTGRRLHLNCVFAGLEHAGWWMEATGNPNSWTPVLFFNPSTSRELGDQLIEQHGIATWKYGDNWCATWPGQSGYLGDCSYIDVIDYDGETGPTRLIAAMRCLVRNLHGHNEIEVPL